MDTQRYSAVARLFHWLVAILVLIQIGIGWAADWTDRPLSDLLLDQHVRIGLLVLLFVILRILWRVAKVPPPLPSAIASWQRLGATITHKALYALLILMPASGYILWAWRGRSLDWWGAGSIPILFRGGEEEFWRSVAGYSHEYGAYLLTALVLLHIGAALHHEFVARDRLIGRRMGFGPLDEVKGAG